MYSSFLTRVFVLFMVIALFAGVSSKPIKMLKQYNMRSAPATPVKRSDGGGGYGPSRTWTKWAKEQETGYFNTELDYTQTEYGAAYTPAPQPKASGSCEPSKGADGSDDSMDSGDSYDSDNSYDSGNS
ncbi:hypothetical protein BDZ97DRAFT_1927708 [Flammula alnicola]|nr:hypothetical protein BDZ97DRAFT_1927708 [Flammula alnicola]